MMCKSIFIEPLEVRLLMSAYILESAFASDSLAPQTLEVPLTTQSTSTQTATTLSVSGQYVDGATLTFTATVSNTDPTAPAPTGDVAFLATRYPTQGSFSNVSFGKFIDPATGGYMAVVLGTVPLSDTGVASLSTNAFHVGTVAIVAVFLGQEPAVLPENYGDGGPLLTPGPYLQEHLGWNAGFGNTNHYVLTDGT